ncbi:hypothetical protein CD155_04040 [Staphylococcus caprae]|nr:hypothetical protein B9K00_11650 [Staphylococcus caprae]HCG75186.1 hypothetical protein [Staphylococcus sp.]POA05856.1 hypothetical protein CD155_04040 [Staphylococcus caprae]QDW94884.1 hypothetical protein DWB96_11795 [Staphylococcus caprae]RIM35659.1 hypothetical protein BU631_02415 [Staphylococcus caprae]
MKYLIYGMNLLNYLILIIWICINFNNISKFGLDIISIFGLFSITLLIISLCLRFLLQRQNLIKNVLNVSIFINLFNVIVLLPILLPILF